MYYTVMMLGEYGYCEIIYDGREPYLTAQKEWALFKVEEMRAKFPNEKYEVYTLNPLQQSLTNPS